MICCPLDTLEFFCWHFISCKTSVTKGKSIRTINCQQSTLFVWSEILFVSSLQMYLMKSMYLIHVFCLGGVIVPRLCFQAGQCRAEDGKKQRLAWLSSICSHNCLSYLVHTKNGKTKLLVNVTISTEQWALVVMDCSLNCQDIHEFSFQM
jgi:hypothetical protein